MVARRGLAGCAGYDPLRASDPSKVAKVPLIVRLKPIPPLAYVLGMSMNPQERGLPAVVLVGGQGTWLRDGADAPNPCCPSSGGRFWRTPSIS
jgi:hypothetical protein